MPINWDSTCICTDSPPNDMNIVDNTVLYRLFMFNRDRLFNPIVISNIPFNMVEL